MKILILLSSLLLPNLSFSMPVENDYVDDFGAPEEENLFLPDSRALLKDGESEDERDRRLGPWLDLKNGGIAIGDPQGVVTKHPDGTISGAYGSLDRGSLLPATGPGLKRAGAANDNYGAGFMISLLENAAAEFSRAYPDTLLYVGSISRPQGGYFYPPHKSHQNGLDADIIFMGQRNWDSVLDKDKKVSARFNREKNWAMWRMLVNQQFAVSNTKVDSIVSMILVAPEIKQYLCAWAKESGALQDPLNYEVMRRIRPTVGHEDHFHLRLRCSPYHTQCVKSYAPPRETGCEAAVEK